MQKEFTLTEMTQMNLPMNLKDPIYSNQSSKLCTSTQKLNKLLLLKPKTKENLEPLTVKQVPSTHYIESRFSAYSHAKVYNKPLFIEISKNTEELSDKSLSVSRFRSSRYPKVPLTRELSEKVQQINSFREISNWTHKKESQQKPSLNISIAKRALKPNMILLHLKTWDLVKKENLRTMRTVGPEVLRSKISINDKEKSVIIKRVRNEEVNGKMEGFENFTFTENTCASRSSCNEYNDRHRSAQRSTNPLNY